MSPDGHSILIGETDKFSILTRARSAKDTQQLRKVNLGSIPFFMSSVMEQQSTQVTQKRPSKDIPIDVTVTGWVKKKKLSPNEKHLQRFEYYKALTSVVKRPFNAPLIVSVLYELEKRDGLELAIGGRDQDALMPVLAFLNKFICKREYSSFLVKVCHIVLDIYWSDIGKNAKVDQQLRTIAENIKKELELGREMASLQATLEFIVNSSIMALPMDLPDDGSSTPLTPEFKPTLDPGLNSTPITSQSK